MALPAAHLVPFISLMLAAASGNSGSGAVGPSASGTRGALRSVFGYDPTPDFIAFDPNYRARHHKYREELDALQAEMVRQGRARRKTPCSRQVFLEARWLIGYTAHWSRIEERLATLRNLLAQPADPPGAEDQVPEDGSFTRCTTAWFQKADASYERLETLSRDWRSPAIRFGFSTGSIVPTSSPVTWIPGSSQTSAAMERTGASS